MITQSYMLNFMAKMPQASSTDIKKPDTQDKTGFPQFGAILDNTINKAPVKLQDSSTANSFEQASKIRDNQSSNDGQQNQVKSYKEVLASRNEAKTEKPEDSQKVSDKGLSAKGTATDKPDEAKEKGKAIVASLAQVLGMKPEDLMKILGSLNIKPEDLADSKKLDEAVDKISSLMGLNTQEKQGLSDIINLIGNQVDASFKQADSSVENVTGLSNNQQNAEVKADTGDNKQGWVKVDSSKIEVVDNRGKTPDLTSLGAEFKSKLDEMVNKLQQNPQETKAQISGSVKTLLEQSKPGSYVQDAAKAEPSDDKAKVSEEKTSKPVDTAKTEEGAKKSNEKAVAIQGDAKSDSKDSGDSEKGGSSNLKDSAMQNIKVESVKVDDGKAVQFNNAMANQVQKSSDTGDVVKLHNDVPVQKNEIINQVVEKAKVVLTNDKSEMVMDLKPDNLGKLSLKVVTEHGMVMAKFVAESDQVKAVLETNMQLLKDSLEKQGLSIQGFSVSVGQDQSRGSKEGTGQESKGTQGASRIGASGERLVSVANIPESMQRINPYNWSDSKINLTA